MTYSSDPFGEIIGLFVGQAQILWPGKAKSAIAKKPLTGSCRIRFAGLEGDFCADLAVHGGPDQAIHHYASDHLAFWQSQYPNNASQLIPGCFGENVSTTGLNEHTLCIGDVLSMGTARVQVSQGREPCWKLNAHTGLDTMAYAFRKSGKTGWYYRVLEPGIVSLNNFMHVMERPAPEWPVHDVIAARFCRNQSRETAHKLSELTPLSKAWRAHFKELARRD